MIVNMSELATAEEIERIVERIEQLNYTAHVNRRERRTVIGVAGASVGVREAEELRKTPGVEAVLRASQHEVTEKRAGWCVEHPGEEVGELV
jgi:predicted GTPase